jgi:hypothetical protein
LAEEKIDVIMKKTVLSILALLAITCVTHAQGNSLPLLKINAGKRYFQSADGKPFFWLGDTGWLLFTKLTREEALDYLNTRQQQGFNVIQAMVLHDVSNANRYGDSALLQRNVAKPNLTPGNDFTNETAYDFWDHVDFVINAAGERGIYMALVPVWGHNVKGGKVTTQQAEIYARFLAQRYKDRNNIIWLNGGDLKGSDSLNVWKKIGNTLRKHDDRHLITFHPRGRYSSSDWFHKESWMDFNMFQSGHRTYAQDTSSGDRWHFGEDNWRYVKNDYAFRPAKPTMDGEPSYENIPHGLHDSLQPRWTDADLRRYAYWSVFAGGAGFTYGENAVMQFHSGGDHDANYGVNKNWKQAVHAPGATQMKYLKTLMLSKSYFDRVPAQGILAGNTGNRYDYLLATRGKNYVMVYTYTGKPFSVDLAKVKFRPLKTSWYNPADGTTMIVENVSGKGVVTFNPPAKANGGTDWVLILEK